MRVREKSFIFRVDPKIPAEDTDQLFEALRVPGVATEVEYYGAGPGLFEVLAGVAFVYSTISAVKDTLEPVKD